MPRLRPATSGLLTIREMAAASGLSEHTLRYYEKIGLIQPIPREGSSGHRRYDESTAVIVETLACLRASGLSIEDMRRHLHLRERGNGAAAEQKQLFEASIAELDAEVRRLAIRRRYLEGKVAYWEARRVGDDRTADRVAAANRLIAEELRMSERDDEHEMRRTS